MPFNIVIDFWGDYKRLNLLVLQVSSLHSNFQRVILTPLVGLN